MGLQKQIFDNNNNNNKKIISKKEKYQCKIKTRL
jgi:hypothetical protein